MKKELQDQLHKDYIRILAKKTSIDVGDGWFNIVDSICDLIEYHLDNLPLEERDQIKVDQIKEKFGVLRFYINHEDQYISGLIDLGESLSGTVCEQCGSLGKLRTGRQRFGSWMQTVCDTCYGIKDND